MPRAKHPPPPEFPLRSDPYADFLVDWEAFTVKSVGRVLPINVITRGSSGHQSKVPLTMKNGNAVRLLWLRHDRFGELA